MTCPWCEAGFPLIAAYGVHSVPEPAGQIACSDMSHYAGLPPMQEQRPARVLKEIRITQEHRDPLFEFIFSDGTVTRTTDPLEYQRLRDLYRVKESRTYG